MELKLRGYQQTALRRLLGGSCLLTDEMGLGKTPTTIMAMRALDPDSALIACPKSLIHVWLEELGRWWPAREFTRYSTGCQSSFVVTNFENLPPSPKRAQKNSILVVDEAHKLKNRKALRTRAVRTLARRHSLRWLLTGTPILNRADDLWSLLNLTAPKQFPSYWRFAIQWCETEPSRWSRTGIEIKSKIKAGQEAAFAGLLAPYVFGRTKGEVGLELPRVTTQDIWLDMTPEQMPLHKDILKKLKVEVCEGCTINVLNVISRIMLARRCCVSPRLLGAPVRGIKYDALDDLLESIGDAHSIVFSQWSDPLMDFFGEKWCVTGDLGERARTSRIDRWREAGGPLPITLGTGGVGLTLVEASYVVLLDPPWVPADIAQAVGRVDRIGQTKPVTVYKLLCKDSVEEMVVKALGDKERLVNLVNQELRRL